MEEGGRLKIYIDGSEIGNRTGTAPADEIPVLEHELAAQPIRNLVMECHWHVCRKRERHIQIMRAENLLRHH